MIFETWFILAVSSALAGGISSFLYKIAAKEKIDIILLSLANAVVAVVLLLIAIFLFSDFSGFWHPMLLFSALTVSTYLISNISKVKSLENIDSTIFFPLYKVLGPALVVIFGLVFFNEVFSILEWIGIGLSLCVPILLISRSEKGRQINLRRGLLWLLVTVFVGAISAAFWKGGADIAPNTWTYLLVGEFFMIPFALLALYQKHGARTLENFKRMQNSTFLKMLAVASVTNTIGGVVFVFALTTGGALGIVYTINSLYILIPIILSIIFYQEHWSIRKAVAVVLSIAALAFFG